MRTFRTTEESSSSCKLFKSRCKAPGYKTPGALFLRMGVVQWQERSRQQTKRLSKDKDKDYYKPSEEEVSIDIPEVVVLTPEGKKKLEKEKYEEGAMHRDASGEGIFNTKQPYKTKFFIPPGYTCKLLLKIVGLGNWSCRDGSAVIKLKVNEYRSLNPVEK